VRVVAIVPRYHDSIIGGSEEYVRRLLRGLNARGVEVEVLTTRDVSVAFESRDALLWMNALPRDAVTADTSVTVRRFRVSNAPAPLRRAWSRRVEAAQARRRAQRRLPLGQSYLAWGFHGVEAWQGDFPFRWTGSRAAVEIEEPEAAGIALEVLAPGRARLRASLDGRPCRPVGLIPWEWSRVEIDLPEHPREWLELDVEPAFRPEHDARELGVAVRSIELMTGRGPLEVSLWSDRESLLARLPTAELAPQLDADARGWGGYTAACDALLKGPLSAGLLRCALGAARGSDVVLATNAPFMTLAYGWLAGRLARKPVLMMPFFHLRDPYHHRPWLRGLLSRADRVLCLSGAMKAFVERSWGGRAALLGGGVDVSELEDPSVEGARFRATYGLGDVPLVLSVARKVPSKGYKIIIEAVRELRGRGIRCEFVLIGPDEDGVRIEPGAAVYLGSRPRAEVLDALDACDVFVLPSLFESFGIAYLEAWLRGKPVVGHVHADAVRELIEPDVDGYLVSGAPDLAAALERLLRDAALRRRLGERGRAKVRESFTWERVVSRACDVLEEVVGR
jgi:glycosyltransferase involved in cell wall biosynthesis